MDNKDDWFALDKLHHILFGFSLTLLFSYIAGRTRYTFLRRYSTWFGSIISLSAGAAKETADEIGFFNSAGASVKDAVADLIGVLIASTALSLCKPAYRIDREMKEERGVSLV